MTRGRARARHTYPWLIALVASGLVAYAAGTAHATAPPPRPGSQTAPTVLPPPGGGEGDAGPLQRIMAQRAAENVPPPPDLAARVEAQTAQLDAQHPGQAPGGRPPAGVPVWREIGPTSVDYESLEGYTGPTTITAAQNARIRKILVDPRNSNVVYVLYASGGLWKTRNFLSPHPFWQPLTDRLTSVASGSIAFGATPDILYLGLGDPFENATFYGNEPSDGGLMYTSTNGGATWSNPVVLPGAGMVTDIAVDTSVTTPVVMVATDNGLFRSANAGKTYALVQHAPADNPVTPVDEQLFTGTIVWSIVRTSTGWLLAGANGGLLDFGNGFLAASSSHGTTWSFDLQNGVDFSYGGRATLAVGTPGDHVVYAFQGWAAPYEAYQRDVFRSTDGGRTWTALHTTTTAPVNPTPETPQVWVASYQAWYDQMIWVDPTVPNRNSVFIGGDLYTARTTDGGATWRMMTQWLGAYGLPYLHADDHTATYVPGPTPMLVVGNDAGLAVSTDHGASWSFDRNNGIVTAAIYGLASTPTNPDEVIVGTQDTGPLIRHGSTGTFSEVIGGDGMVPAVSQANSATSLIALDDGEIDRATGLPLTRVTNWTVANEDDDAWFYTPLVAPSAAADPTGRIFYSYTVHKVLRSADGGRTWTPILSVDPSGPPVTRNSTMNLAVDPQNVNGIAVGDYNGLVHVTHNGGATWRTSDLLDVAAYGGFNSAVGWARNHTLYLGSENQAAGATRVMRSTNGGATWTAASGGLPDVPIVKLTPDLSDPTGRTVYAGTWIGVYRTTDGGTTWTFFGAGLPHVFVSDVYVAPDGSFVRVGTFGRGVWEASLH